MPKPEPKAKPKAEPGPAPAAIPAASAEQALLLLLHRLSRQTKEENELTAEQARQLVYQALSEEAAREQTLRPLPRTPPPRPGPIRRRRKNPP